MNLMGFFQIRCGWLPFTQMIQDLIQAGDITPNLLGLLSGHVYYYASEVAPRLLLPDRVSSADVLRGPPPAEADDDEGEAVEAEGADRDEGAASEGGEGGDIAAGEDGGAGESLEEGEESSTAALE